MRKLRPIKLISDDRGATAIEYALIVGVLALSIVAALSAIGHNVSGLLMSVSNDFH